MRVNGIQIPEKALTNIDLEHYVKVLNISNFVGVFMKNELPKKKLAFENGIMNFNTTKEEGTHWVCWYKTPKNIIYFDSFAQHVPYEVM